MRWGGGQMAHRRKLIIKGIILHLKQQKACQGTLGTQVLTYIRFKTSFGPSIDPTDPLKWTLWFLSILQYFKKLLYIFEEKKILQDGPEKTCNPCDPWSRKIIKHCGIYLQRESKLAVFHKRRIFFNLKWLNQVDFLIC